MSHWHRHIGVYGICYHELNNKLLVIKKVGGPYNKKYDLPGGSLELKETLEQSLKREFIEETGYNINVEKSIGVSDFLVDYSYKGSELTHHIAMFYRISLDSLEVMQLPSKVPHNLDIKQNDSESVHWIDIDNINKDLLSPLVKQAIDWIKHGNLNINA